jgi:hypothetical protein
LDEIPGRKSCGWKGLGWNGALGQNVITCHASAWNASWVIFHSINVCPDNLQL